MKFDDKYLDFTGLPWHIILSISIISLIKILSFSEMYFENFVIRFNTFPHVKEVNLLGFTRICHE